MTVFNSKYKRQFKKKGQNKSGNQKSCPDKNISGAILDELGLVVGDPGLCGSKQDFILSPLPPPLSETTSCSRRADSE